MKRTNYNGELRLANVGEEVTLVGWVSTRRNLGSILFIDLRDNTGIVQLCVEDPSKVPDVRNEYVVQVEGVVRKKDVPNPKLPSGDIEVLVKDMKVINKAENPPFIIADKTDALEDTRLEYRYLDLRRPCMLNNLRTRAKIVKITHDYLDSNRFLEVETPILDLATPEGARDYLVPSRLHHGCFYALPQSPQLFKQLLMIGGIERYYQIAKCFRDEDLRADRQPEFTQIDVETSFMDQDQVLELAEGMLKRYFKEIVNVDIKLPLRRINYWEAMDTYGSDKPDTRYGLHIQDVSEILKKTDFASFKDAKYIKGILIPLRTLFAKEMSLIKAGTYDLLWVVNFPMFDRIEGTDQYTAEHHPFTRPRDEDLPLLDTDPEKVLAYAYDIVINGYEAGGGTLRIYDHDTQWKIFRLLGLSEEDVERKFGWFLRAFRYGVPPHAGFALGLDRLCMILCGTDNIRDVEAFPKNLQATDPMSKAPSIVSQEALDAVGVEIKKE